MSTNSNWAAVNVLSTALAFLTQRAVPDVIISDYRLPGDENGMEAVARLRSAAGRRIPACLMSGDTEPDLMQRAREIGLTLLHKPVRPAKLRSLVRRLAQEARDVAARSQVDGADLR